MSHQPCYGKLQQNGSTEFSKGLDIVILKIAKQLLIIILI